MESSTAKVNPMVYYGLWVLWFALIVIYNVGPLGKTCIILVNDVDNEKGYISVG